VSEPLRIHRIGRLWRPGGVVAPGAVHIRAGRVVWAGPAAAEPTLAGAREIDAAGALVTPGLVDAHTHPVYLTARLGEVAERSAGRSYASLAAAGGGIAATAEATRAAPADQLTRLVHQRLARWPAGGATAVEAKTGYHLQRAGELAAVRLLAESGDLPGMPAVSATFLAAHALPPEGFAGGYAGFADEVAAWCEPAARAGARSVDVFCDEGYFSIAEARIVLQAGRSAGLALRVHADELARTGAARLAAELGAASADHLLRIDEGDARALAAAGVTGVLCPFTAVGMGVLPPVGALRAAGTRLALGSDHNPGTSGVTSMAAVVGLAVAGLGLSVDEALRAATVGGAGALGGDYGSLRSGESADLVVWDADHEGAFAWAHAECRPALVLRAGEPLYRAG
jgi:imidazolonepropionase